MWGATGYLGAHVAGALRDEGHSVVDADSAGPYDAVVFSGIDTFSAYERPAVGDEEFAAEKAALASLLELDARAFVLTSYASVYAPDAPSPVLETSGLRPATARGEHSLALEELVRDARGDAPYAILRCASLGGKVEDVTVSDRVLKGNHLPPGLTLTGTDYPGVAMEFSEASADGEIRDLVHVADAASAHVRAAELLVTQGGLLVANVGSGSAYTAEDVESAAADTARADVRVLPAPADVPAAPRVLSADAIAAATGWGADPARTVPAIRGILSAARTRAIARARYKGELAVENEFLWSTLRGGRLSIHGVLLVSDKKRYLANRRVRFRLAGTEYAPRVFSERPLRLPFGDERAIPYVLHVPAEEVERFGTHTGVYLEHADESGRWFRTQLPYSRRRSGRAHCRGPLHRIRGGAFRAYVRQSLDNLLYVTVRPENLTDAPAVGLRIALGRLAAAVRPSPVMLLWEKQLTHYEESASVVFERLVDDGRTDARFVLRRDRWDLVGEKYRRYLVPAYSVRHFHHFFGARTLLSTETVQHAVEHRTAYRSVLRRITRGDFGYVFLQHGVMYMVSLDSEHRRFFRAGVSVVPKNSKVVCSSQVEADHFVELGGFDRANLYVTGLPKFDRARRDEGADRILIMPTWRPWDQNLVKTNPEQAPYHHMLAELFAAVPEHLRERTWLLPHPHARAALAETDLAPRIWTGSYDEALRGCSLLVTDYSSIAYDAFYRGANVIFWWKDKEECMRRYGGRLMLDDGSAFGPVVNDAEDLSHAVAQYADTPQREEYVKRYKHIVEFHDGRNTERLIRAMERDGML